MGGLTRDEVFQEFTRWTGWPNTTGTIHQTHWYDTDAMAEEIVRLRDRLAAVEAERDTLKEQLTHQTYTLTAEHQRAERILAALREPSEAVKIAVQEAVEREALAPCHYREAEQIVRAAVAAAEKEARA